MAAPKFHKAVATVGPKAPLELISVPTPSPKPRELVIRGEWTASTPLDLHQADGGLLVTHPQVLGDSLAGTVVGTGSEVTRFKVGDRVFGFAWRGQGEKAHQEFTVGDERLWGKVRWRL
jgi:NADPH:quinone reductase-like Zn-dependent oxidoreductase